MEGPEGPRDSGLLAGPLGPIIYLGGVIMVLRGNVMILPQRQ
jgi:hypothetical protein